MTFLLLSIAAATGIPLLYRFIRVRSVNKRVEGVLRDKNGPVSREVAENLGMGASVAGLSVLDIYSSTSKHGEILDVIERRYPNEMGGAGAFDWLNKVSEGENTIKNYERAYAGEQAEIESVDRLRELGYTNVEQFPDKNHPDNDIKAVDTDGNEVLFSVKSYDDADRFKSVVDDHPNSTHYVVNEEVYDELEKSGGLSEYKSKGIEIIDGGYSHAEHMEEASTALEDVASSADVLDDIGIVAVAFFGIKTIKNVKDHLEGSQSSGELGINVAGDAAGVGARGVGAVAGAEIGATIGTFLLPGVGTFIGGAAGALGGIMIGGGVVESIKEDMKWGDIIEATEYFGETYYHFFKDYKDKEYKRYYRHISCTVLNKICHTGRVRGTLKGEKEKLGKLSSLFSRIGLAPRNLKESLVLLHVGRLKKYLDRVSKNIDDAFESLKEVTEAIDERIPEEEPERDEKIYRCTGEFILENRALFIDMDGLDDEERELVDGYAEQSKKNPNHPYKAFKNSRKDLRDILRESLAANFIKTNA